MQVRNLTNESSGPQMRYALLVYEDGERAAATFHTIRSGENGPAIQAGQPVQREQFLEIAERIAGAPEGKERVLLDAGLLLADPDLLVWYRPSHRRAMFWKTKEKELDALDGKDALHPPLLFVARQHALYVYALPGDKRPTMETKLYRAPYYNTYANGHLCEGNIRLPDHYRPDGIAQWERAFFDTNFAHTNIEEQKLTRYPGGHAALWKALSVERGRSVVQEFDLKWLVALKDATGKKPLTLKAVI